MSPRRTALARRTLAVGILAAACRPTAGASPAHRLHLLPCFVVELRERARCGTFSVPECRA